MLANWVRQSTSTVGTGDIVLDGTPDAGFISFSTAFRDGELVNYLIEDGNNREEGVGTLTAGANWTLARVFVTAALENGTYTETPANGVSLSGNAVVSVGAGARQVRGLPKKLGGGTTASGTYRHSGLLGSRLSGTKALSADTVYYQPFLVDEYYTITELGIKILTAGAAGTTMQLGVYLIDNTYTRPSRIIAKTALVAADVTGFVVSALDNPVSVRRGDLFYLAIAANGGISVTAGDYGKIGNGYSSPLPWRVSTSYQDIYYCAYESLTAGWASLPANASTTWFLLSDGPAIFTGE